MEHGAWAVGRVSVAVMLVNTRKACNCPEMDPNTRFKRCSQNPKAGGLSL